MRIINAEELMELYKAPEDIPEWNSFFVPIPVIRQNILDMPVLDSIIFPQIIGNITFYSSEELIEWVKNHQIKTNF